MPAGRRSRRDADPAGERPDVRGRGDRRMSGLAPARSDLQTDPGWLGPDGEFVAVPVLNYHRRSVRVGSTACPASHGYFTVGPALGESRVVAEMRC